MAVDQGKVVKVFTILMLLFSFSLCIANFVSARECFTEPCYKGIGVANLWSVESGKSFQGVTLALVCFFHAMFSYWILFKIKFDEMKYGMLVSYSFLLAIALLVQAVYYGQNTTMVNQLHEHLAGNYFYEDDSYCSQAHSNSTICDNLGHNCRHFGKQCLRAMGVQLSVRDRFNAVVAFSVLLGITQTAFAVILISWKSEFGNQFGNFPAQPQYQAKQSTVRVTSGAYNPAVIPAPEQAEQVEASYQAENLRL